MKLLFIGLLKIIYCTVLFLPIVLLGIVDLIRSAGKGEIITNEESWSYKLTKWL